VNLHLSTKKREEKKEKEIKEILHFQTSGTWTERICSAFHSFQLLCFFCRPTSRKKNRKSFQKNKKQKKKKTGKKKKKLATREETQRTASQKTQGFSGSDPYIIIILAAASFDINSRPPDGSRKMVNS
jgi:hypothetical protein